MPTRFSVATLDETDTQPIFDGLQVKVTGPELTFTSFQVTQNAAGVLDPPEIGCFAFNSNGFPFWMDTDRPDKTRQQTNGSGWGIHTGETGDASFEWFITRTTQGGARWSEISPYDFEIRFNDDTDNWGLEPSAFNGAANVLIQVPFELWNIGVATPDDPSDDYRLFPYLIDNNVNAAFDLSGIDHTLSGGDNDPETDWFYWVKPADITPGEAGYNVIRDDAVNNTAGHEYLGPTTAGTDVLRRMVLVNWNGGSVSAANFPANMDAVMPESGNRFPDNLRQTKFGQRCIFLYGPGGYTECNRGCCRCRKDQCFPESVLCLQSFGTRPLYHLSLLSIIYLPRQLSVSLIWPEFRLENWRRMILLNF